MDQTLQSETGVNGIDKYTTLFCLQKFHLKYNDINYLKTKAMKLIRANSK